MADCGVGDCSSGESVDSRLTGSDIRRSFCDVEVGLLRDDCAVS